MLDDFRSHKTRRLTASKGIICIYEFLHVNLVVEDFFRSPCNITYNNMSKSSDKPHLFAVCCHCTAVDSNIHVVGITMIKQLLKSVYEFFYKVRVMNSQPTVVPRRP